MSNKELIHKLRNGIYLLLLVSAIGSSVYGDETRRAPEGDKAVVTLANDQISLAFEVNNDLRLNSVEEVASGAIFTFKNKPIWKIYARDIVSGFELLVAPTTHSFTFNHTYTDHGTYKDIVAVWSDLVINASNRINSVTVTATLDNEAVLADMKIEVDSDLTDYSLFRIFFPDFYLQAIGGDGTDDLFTFPQHGGYIIDDPIHNLDPMGWPNPGYFSMQFFTYYDDSGLLYMGTDDTVGYLRLFAMTGNVSENAVYWRIENYPENNTLPGEVNYTMPCNFKIGALEGDWYDACVMYRKWALDHIVTRKRIDDPETDFNPTLLDIDGLCGYNLGIPSVGLTPAVLQGMKDSKAFYGVDKVATALYLWTNEPTSWAMWPDVTAHSTIVNGIQEMHNDGDLVFLYTQIACNVNAPSYINNNWDIYALQRLDGSLYYIDPLVNMDQTIPFWQNHVMNWNITYTVMLDCDGVFWDYWSGYNNPCYNPNHGHPVGGGSHNTQGKRYEAGLVLDALHQIPGYENWFITSEYANEFFIDYNEIEMWNEEHWDESIGQMPMIRLPMYETVYGDRQYLWILTQTNKMEGPYEDLMSYTVASRMTEGLVLGFVGTSIYPYHPGASLPYGQTSFEFLGLLMRSYDYARKYLMWGQRMRTVQVNNVASTDYYDIQTLPTNLYGNHWIYTSSFPKISNVLPSVWRSEKDPLNPTLALALINWNGTQQSIDYTFKFDDYGLRKGRPYRIKELTANGSTVIDTVTDDFTRNDTLDARSLKILEIVPVLQMKKPGGIAH